MNTPDYWPMAREYLVWTAAISTLQFWTAPLEASTLNSAIEAVYMAFFYTDTSYRLHWQSNETLFSCFVTTLNAAFEHKLALEDEGYERGSENFNMPTPLRWIVKIHHVSSAENASFNPTPVPPHTSRIYIHLTYSSCDDTSDDEATTSTTPDHSDTSNIPADECHSTTPIHLQQDKEDEMDEDFQTVPLDDDHWTDEQITDRTLCIHSLLLQHELCAFPCPYVDYLTSSYLNEMDLSDISEFEDYMVTSSDEDIPSLED